MPVYQLSIPNVSVSLASPEIVSLDGNAKEELRGSFNLTVAWQKELQSRLQQRNWRELRNQFLSLNLDDRDAVADWLDRVGYIPEYPSSAEAANIAWVAEDVTRDIIDWLRTNREAVEWLMSLEHSAFVEAIDAAWEWVEQRQKEWARQIDSTAGQFEKNPTLKPPKPRQPKEPSAALARRLHLPSRINPDILQRHLMGGAGLQPQRTLQLVQRRQTHRLRVARTPMMAISLSTHIDRNFSKLRLASCDYCGQTFTQKLSNQRFHTQACHDKWHNERKAQLRDLKTNKRRK